MRIEADFPFDFSLAHLWPLNCNATVSSIQGALIIFGLRNLRQFSLFVCRETAGK